MLRIGRNTDDKVFDSEGILSLFPLLMKPVGQVHFALDTSLMVCLRDDRENAELLVSFEGPFRLQLAVGRFQSLLMLASRTQNGHSIEDLLNFLMVFWIRVLLKFSFLKWHKTDLEQYPLAPTIIAKISTYQPIDSMIVFKTKYLLISTVPGFHIFFTSAC